MVGSWHDTRIEHFLNIDNILTYLPPQYKIAVDTGIVASARKIRSLSDTELGALSAQQASAARTAGTLLARIRTAAEWGVGGIHNAWRILRLPGAADDPQGRVILAEVCIRLHNLRCRVMDVCQIRNVFTN